MFGTTVDTIIGVVLVFLLFSTLLTTLMEVLAGVLKLRAKALEDTVTRLLAGGASTLAADILQHPMIAGSAKSGKPSYIPAQTFSAAVLQALGKLTASGKLGDLVDVTELRAAINSLPEGPAKALNAIVDQAVAQAKSVEERGLLIKQGVETWFDAAMDRLSGEYKRFTQVITLVVGLAVAVAFNVDAIRITQRLYAEPAVRASLETVAQKAVAQQGAANKPAASAASATSAAPSDATPVTLDAIRAQLKPVQTAETALAGVGPVGWGGGPPADTGAWLLAALGWVLTALAGMLGAPFWFDTLNSLMNIRNAGPKPVSSTSPQSN